MFNFSKMWESFGASFKEMDDSLAEMDRMMAASFKDTAGADTEEVREEEVRPDGTRITRVIRRARAKSTK